MRTIIFMLAISAIAGPALAGAGDAVGCASPRTAQTQNCAACISDASGNPTNACYNCKIGYYLTYTGAMNGVCNRCAPGTGSFPDYNSRPASSETASICTACPATCLECLVPGTTANSQYFCTRCPAGKFITDYQSIDVTGACGGTCSAGTTKDADTADITQAGSQAQCTASCDPACATCLGTGANRCTKCAPYYWASAFSSASGVATCSLCSNGKYRTTAQATNPAAIEVENTVCNASCDSTCAACKGSTAASCAKCAVDRYATMFTANTGTATCAACDAGTTRAVAANALIANEDRATTCMKLVCDPSCASCKGTAKACTKCAAGYFLSARTGTETIGTCSPCTEGKGKDADAAEFTATTAIVTKTACTATCTAASNCDSCSAAEPAKCITCAAGSTLDATTKTCSKPAAQGSSASLLQVICGATIAAYALF